MNWEAIGAIGQMLGSFAVFVTLGYLAVQVGHAKREVQRSIRQGRGEAVRELFLTRATDEGLLKFAAKASAALGIQPPQFVEMLMERAGLAREEADALGNELWAWWNYRLQIIPYVNDLLPIDRTAFEVSIRAQYGGASLQRFFYESVIKTTQHPDVVRYIDNLLAQPN